MFSFSTQVRIVKKSLHTSFGRFAYFRLIHYPFIVKIKNFLVPIPVLFLLRNLFDSSRIDSSLYSDGWYKSVYGADKDFYFFLKTGRHMDHDPIPKISVTNSRSFNPIGIFPNHPITHLGKHNFLFSKSDFIFNRDKNLLPFRQEIASKLSSSDYVRMFSYSSDNFITNYSQISTFDESLPMLILDGFDDGNFETFFESSEFESNVNIIIFQGENLNAKLVDKYKHLQVYRGSPSGFNSYLYHLIKSVKFKHVIYLNNGTLFDTTWVKDTLARIAQDGNINVIFPTINVGSKLLCGFRLTRRGFLVPLYKYKLNRLNYEDLIPVSSGLVLSNNLLVSIFENGLVKFDLIFNEYNTLGLECSHYSNGPLLPNITSALSYNIDEFELRSNYERESFVNVQSHLLYNCPNEKLGHYNRLSKAPSISKPIVLFAEEQGTESKFQNLKNLFESAGFFVIYFDDLADIFFEHSVIQERLDHLDHLLQKAVTSNLISLIVCFTDYFDTVYNHSKYQSLIDPIPKMYLRFEKKAYADSQFVFKKLDKNSVPDLYKKYRHIYADFYSIDSFSSNIGLQKLTSYQLRLWFEQLLGKTSSLRKSVYGR